jgi:hypothetical protein
MRGKFSSVIVYTDSDIIDREWLAKLEFNSTYTVCHNFEEYIASVDPLKIAFTTHRLHCDYDGDCKAYAGFEDKIRQLSLHSQLVFTFESELHNFHWHIWDLCHRDNVYWVLPGAVNDNDNMRRHIIFWADWFKTTSFVYKKLPDKLAEISYQLPKPKSFDALLGSPKPHRDFVAQAVAESLLQDKFIMPYGGAWNDNGFYAEGYFIWEKDVVPFDDRPLISTADPFLYCGVHTGLSRIIPIDTFNQTAYSIVAETDHDNTLSFYTEKTAKPLIARRLFVAFTGYKFLQNLRTHGFQTFGAVIDEGYDLIKDDAARYTAAFEQVKQLCNMDQAEVYAKIQPVLEHNHNLIMTTDWTTYAANQIQDIINSAQL